MLVLSRRSTVAWTYFLCVLLALVLPVTAEEKESSPEPPGPEKIADAKSENNPGKVLAGHSFHGEAFNEGPRQKAYLMEGTGKVRFPVTTTSKQAQQFIEQGVGQLHGFWYFEAERTFRQAAALDPQCAMAYWGMAMANANNASRAKGFISEAHQRKDKVTPRERKYIEALYKFVNFDGKNDAKKKKQRYEKYTKALEDLILDHPEDVEAMAFLAVQLWKNRSGGLAINSYLAVDALLDQVFAAEPMHPAHHYRIHLWDNRRPEKALASAARGGQSSPSIAHMWHMPGHIYSRLKRYVDACWQQEASARVDHAHMMRDRVMPDQIHNFAHNNEWLIRNLIHVGRVRDAMDLAKNMIELPQHPKYNTLDKRGGSASYGRQRLFDVLTKYELWEEMIALCDTPYLAATEKETEQVKRLRLLGMACFRHGDSRRGEATLAELESMLPDIQKEKDEAVKKAVAKIESEKKADEDEAKLKKRIEKARKTAARPLDTRKRAVEKALQEVQGHQAVFQGDFSKGLERLKKASGLDRVYLANVQWQAGEKDKAEKAIRAHVRSHKKEVQPLAGLVEFLWMTEKRDEAKKAFERLREISSVIDEDASPVFTRLTSIAKELGQPDDWKVVKSPADDVGDRPELDSLGPFRWRPSPAPAWTLKDVDGHAYSLSDYHGKPLIVIFYLGYGCLHCAEQLQAFAPMAKQFEDVGISLLAVSSDNQEGLRRSIDNYTKGAIPFPLVSDASLETFKAYRAFDDFENQPLHGTFLIDAQGLVRWQDISYEPFNDPKFVLKEAQRLLTQTPAP